MDGWENYGINRDLLIDPSYIPSFSELSVEYPELDAPLLDQPSLHLQSLTPDQKHWRDHGYLIKRNFISDSLIEQYNILRDGLGLGDDLFPDPHPHLYSSVIRDICCSRELHHLLIDLIGEEMGLQFSLNGYKSSQRGWHQDDYFNPEGSQGRYLAVWMAMGDIDPDSGPFEFVPGSHKWPCLRGEKVRQWLKPEAATTSTAEWMIAAEYFVNKAAQEQINATGSEVVQFAANKGDLLIWHAKLLHRGSIPKNPALTRPALISHYSSVRSRRDVSWEITRHGDGGYFYEFSQNGEALSEDKVPRTDAAGLSNAVDDTSSRDPRASGDWRSGVEASLGDANAHIEALHAQAEHLKQDLADMRQAIEKQIVPFVFSLDAAVRQKKKWRRALQPPAAR